jgi:hypothetical protein
MPLVARCQRKILIAIAADEPMHTVMDAVIAAPARLLEQTLRRAAFPPRQLGTAAAEVQALRVERRAPFCAALALWLSMIAAVGLASSSAAARTAT